MKKVILPVLAISILIAFIAPLALGATTDTKWAIPAATEVDIWTVIERIIGWFFNLVVWIGVIFVIYAGFLYLTSAGDETKLKTAMSTLVYALVGIGVAIIAKGIIYLVTTMLLGGTTTIIP